MIIPFISMIFRIITRMTVIAPYSPITTQSHDPVIRYPRRIRTPFFLPHSFLNVREKQTGILSGHYQVISSFGRVMSRIPSSTLLEVATGNGGVCLPDGKESTKQEFHHWQISGKIRLFVFVGTERDAPIALIVSFVTGFDMNRDIEARIFHRLH